MPAPYGEDVPLAEAVGLDVVRLHPGGTARINPLDPGPGGALDGPEELARRQATMVGALLASVLHRDLTPEEDGALRSEEHTSELQSLMRNSYAVFCLKKKNYNKEAPYPHYNQAYIFKLS